jgi:hypothetical protein
MRLVIVAGPGAGGTIEVPESGLSVGRESGNDLVVPDDLVSRRHLRLTPSAGGLVVEDLGSSNGTYVSGIRVAEPMLAPAGGIIQLGSTILRVEGEAPTSVSTAALGAPTLVDPPPAAWVTTPLDHPAPVSGPPDVPPPPLWGPNVPPFPPPVPSRRPVALVVIAAVAVLAIGLVAAGFVFFAGGSDSPEADTTRAAPTTPAPTSAAPTPSASEAPSTEPSEDPSAEPSTPRTAPPSQEPTIEAGALTDSQQELLNHVPDPFRETCSNPGYKHEGASAAVGCEPSSGADYAQYNQYETAETMDQKYKFWTAGFDYGPTSDDCTDDGFGRFTYSYTGGVEGGSITCYMSDGAAWVEWTENDLVIYSFAARDDGDFAALFQWWLDESGPY